MKKIFSILLACSCAIAIASEDCEDNRPGTENTQEASYRICDECGDPDCKGKPPASHIVFGTKDTQDFNKPEAFRTGWRNYEIKFGAESISVLMPANPIEIMNGLFAELESTEYGATYNIKGYYPPISHISAHEWFDQLMKETGRYASKVDATITHLPSGVSFMDYIAYDNFLNTVTQGRVIVTKFNGYILTCKCPQGNWEEYTRFKDSCLIRYDN